MSPTINSFFTTGLVFAYIHTCVYMHVFCVVLHVNINSWLTAQVVATHVRVHVRKLAGIPDTCGVPGILELEDAPESFGGSFGQFFFCILSVCGPFINDSFFF